MENEEYYLLQLFVGVICCIFIMWFIEKGADKFWTFYYEWKYKKGKKNDNMGYKYNYRLGKCCGTCYHSNLSESYNSDYDCPFQPEELSINKEYFCDKWEKTHGV